MVGASGRGPTGGVGRPRARRLEGFSSRPRLLARRVVAAGRSLGGSPGRAATAAPPPVGRERDRLPGDDALPAPPRRGRPGLDPRQGSAAAPLPSRRLARPRTHLRHGLRPRDSRGLALRPSRDGTPLGRRRRPSRVGPRPPRPPCGTPRRGGARAGCHTALLPPTPLAGRLLRGAPRRAGPPSGERAPLVAGGVDPERLRRLLRSPRLCARRRRLDRRYDRCVGRDVFPGRNLSCDRPSVGAGFFRDLPRGGGGGALRVRLHAGRRGRLRRRHAPCELSPRGRDRRRGALAPGASMPCATPRSVSPPRKTSRKKWTRNHPAGRLREIQERERRPTKWHEEVA